MLPHRFPRHAASQQSGTSAFDRFTLNAFMLAVTVTAAAVVACGPAAALHHIADVLAAARTLPLPDETAWSGQMVF